MIARELAADPQRDHRRAADARAGRRRDRVRPPAAVEERDAGRGVLLVSLELEEIRSLSDRVLVIYEGQIVAELPPESSEEDFGADMTGGGAR